MGVGRCSACGGCVAIATVWIWWAMMMSRSQQMHPAFSYLPRFRFAAQLYQSSNKSLVGLASIPTPREVDLAIAIGNFLD